MNKFKQYMTNKITLPVWAVYLEVVTSLAAILLLLISA